MAKRFTDTDKWKKEWFVEIRGRDKLLWQYLCDNCDHAGIWDVNLVLASRLCGFKYVREDVKQIFGKQIKEFDNGKRWWIPSFIKFQYDCAVERLNPKNIVHRSVLRTLVRYDLYSLSVEQQGAFKELPRGFEAPKDKDKDKEKDKEKAVSTGVIVKKKKVCTLHDNGKPFYYEGQFCPRCFTPIGEPQNVDF